jgi:mRNA interferase MazF
MRGDILIIEFPYSDLKYTKRRPILVLKVPKGEDILACQITGSSYEKPVEIPLKEDDFKQGSLKRESYVRIDKIASVEKSLIRYKIGSLNQEKFNLVLNKVCEFLKG